MNQLFQNFQRILCDAESVDFMIRRHEKGLEVIVTPILDKAPTDLSEQDAEFRGALAMPLYACDDAAALDASFFVQLTKYAAERETLALMCQSIDTLREAGKQAKTVKQALEKKKDTDKRKSGAGGSADKSEKTSQPESAPRPSVATDQNPGDLFGAQS